MTIFSGTIFFIIILLFYQKQKYYCLNYLLKAQQTMIKPMKNILSLNIKAKNLRKELSNAQKLLQTAIISGEPKAILAAKVYVNLVKGKITLLTIKQQKIIATAKLKSYFIIKRYKTKLNYLTLQENFFLKKWINIKNKSIKTSRIKFSLIKTDTILPSIYKISPFLKKRQTLYAHWKYHIKLLDNIFLHQKLKDNFTIHGKCATTLSIKGNIWKTIPQMDK